MTRPAPFGFSKVVFLSHVLTTSTTLFPGDPAVEIRPAATISDEGYFLQRVTFGEQSGTHWAAAAHFSAGELAADQLDASDFFFEAVVLDHRADAEANPDYAVTIADLQRWEAGHGQIREGVAVLLLSGYDARWEDESAYLGDAGDGAMHYPGFGEQAVRWLIDERHIGALGTDTMGIDPGPDHTFAGNALLLHGNRLHLENLRGLDQLPPSGGWIIVGGVRVQGGSGSPATIFGLVP